MAAHIIDGEAVAEEIKQQVAADAAALTEAGRKPHLTAVQVGENPASKIYTNMQAKACESVRLRSSSFRCLASAIPAVRHCSIQARACSGLAAMSDCNERWPAVRP